METGICLSHVRKSPRLLIQQVGTETLIYNEKTHNVFCLNAVAAQVWQRLDGFHTAAEIAAAATLDLRTVVTREMVLFTIVELRRDGLLEPESSSTPLPIPGRRELMRQLGAGAILMLPVIATVMAPKAAQAYTGCFDCAATPADSHAGARATPQQMRAIEAAQREAARKQKEAQDATRDLFTP